MKKTITLILIMMCGTVLKARPQERGMSPGIKEVAYNTFPGEKPRKEDRAALVAASEWGSGVTPMHKSERTLPRWVYCVTGTLTVAATFTAGVAFWGATQASLENGQNLTGG